MKKATNLEIGKVIQFPKRQFAPFRHGWNGWLFGAGIIKDFGTAQSGARIVKVEFPVDNYAQKWVDFRGESREGERKTIERWFLENHIFEADSSFKRAEMDLEHPRDYWSKGCYNADTEFLIDKGVIPDYQAK